MQRALLFDDIPDPFDDPRLRLVAQLRSQFLPRLRLGDLEKPHQRMRDQTQLPVIIRRPGDVKPIQRHQIRHNGILKILLG